MGSISFARTWKKHRSAACLCEHSNESSRCVQDGHFSYSHRLRSGVNRDSHGIKVARLASMPQSVIDMAEEALAALKAGGTSADKASLRALGQHIASTHSVHLAPQ
jgi:DNA mismatch repair ATPase MutS